MSAGEQPRSEPGRHRAPAGSARPRGSLVAGSVIAVAGVVAVGLGVSFVRGSAETGPIVVSGAAATPSRSPSSSPSGATSPSPPPSATPSPTATPTATPTPSAAPLGVGEPRQAAQALLTAFEKAVDAAPRGHLVATARLGAGVSNTPVEVQGRWAGGSAASTAADAALLAGRFRTPRPLSTAAGTGQARGPGRRVTDLPLRSPADALTALARTGGPGCGDCPPLVITGARAARMSTATTIGRVDIPAWRLSVADQTATVLVSALDPGALIQVAAPYRGAVGRDLQDAQVPLWRVRVGADDRTVTANLGRDQGPVSRTCWRVQAVESQHAVALYAAADATEGPPGRGTVCADTRGRGVARLDGPLGGRTLLDVYWQRALPTR